MECVSVSRNSDSRSTSKGKVGILTEKPSAARNFAAALGGMSGTFDGTEYVIVSARGHLLELKDPSAMVPEALAERYTSWELANLPWRSEDFRWEREIRRKLSGGKLVTDKDAKSLLAQLKTTLSGCDTVCNAADLDPTGEGSLLGWEIVEFLGLQGKKLERMEFLDETPASLQKAFRTRRPVSSIEDEVTTARPTSDRSGTCCRCSSPGSRPGSPGPTRCCGTAASSRRWS